MSVVISFGSAAVMVMFAAGMYNLQWWLERSDYERHFDD